MLYFNLDERTDEYARPLIQDTVALDELDDAARQMKLRVDSSAALPKVFVIVLTEDARRVDHFHKHLSRRLPEAEQFEALNAKEDPVGTAQELDRLRVSLSTSAHRWRDHRVEGLRLDDAWVSTARTGEVGVTASQISVWERIANSDPTEVPYALILEDDAVVLPTFHRDTVRAMVDELDRGVGMKNHSSNDSTWHVAYIYLRPEDFPEVSESEQNQFVRPGGYSWSLLAYLVSHAGAERLLKLAQSEPLYGPIDDMISHWEKRSLLNVAFPTRRDLVENAGHLNDNMPSNINDTINWATTLHAAVSLRKLSSSAEAAVARYMGKVSHGQEPNRVKKFIGRQVQFLGFDQAKHSIVGVVGVRTMQPRTSYIGVVDSFDKSKVAFSGGFKSPFRFIAEDGETSRSTASLRNAVHTVHTPPAASDEALGSTIPVSWTAAAGTDLVDVHICRDKVLDPSACVRVRSAMKAQKFGESGNSFTLRIGGETRGGKKKSWQMPQEPCKLGLN